MPPSPRLAAQMEVHVVASSSQHRIAALPDQPSVHSPAASSCINGRSMPLHDGSTAMAYSCRGCRGGGGGKGGGKGGGAVGGGGDGGICGGGGGSLGGRVGGLRGTGEMDGSLMLSSAREAFQIYIMRPVMIDWLPPVRVRPKEFKVWARSQTTTGMPVTGQRLQNLRVSSPGDVAVTWHQGERPLGLVL